MTLVGDIGTIAFETQPATPMSVDGLYTIPRPCHVSVNSRADTSCWVIPVLERLQAISELTDNWDGYGSPAPEAQTLIAALEVLRQFIPASVATPSVAPTTTGGIQFEWHQGGWDIEIEVFPDGRAVAWGENLNMQETFHGSVEESREDLVLHLKQLTTNAASRR